MTRFHATTNGQVPFTEEEELERNAKEANWAEGIPERERKSKIQKLTASLEAGAIEHIIDNMDIGQRKKLPVDLLANYDQIKQLRKEE